MSDIRERVAAIVDHFLDSGDVHREELIDQITELFGAPNGALKPNWASDLSANDSQRRTS